MSLPKRYLLGGALLLLAVLVLYLGKQEYFGYMEKHYLLAAVLALVLGLLGGLLCASELTAARRRGG